MFSLRLTGFSSITLSSAGSPPKAIAAKVSIIILIQSSWIIVSGNSIPNIGPRKTVVTAAKFTVSWKTMNIGSNDQIFARAMFYKALLDHLNCWIPSILKIFFRPGLARADLQTASSLSESVMLCLNIFCEVAQLYPRLTSHIQSDL